MSVAFDNVAAVSGDFVNTLTTGAFTIGAGANRAAQIILIWTSNDATGITCSLGGVSGTLVSGTDTGIDGGSPGWRAAIYQVIAPPSGSQTATASWTNGGNHAQLSVITATSVDQTTPVIHGTYFADPSNSATNQIAITSVSGNLTVSACGCGAGVTSTNQTIKWTGLVNGTDLDYGGDIGPGTGTTTHIWTLGGTGGSIVLPGADFLASGGVAPSTLWAASVM